VATPERTGEPPGQPLTPTTAQKRPWLMTRAAWSVASSIWMKLEIAGILVMVTVVVTAW
jgi:hypothetical protein